MSRTVLIVDDHAPFRSWARCLLEDEGFEVVGAVGDVAGAREALRRLRPDVVLLDVQLPDGDGIDVAAELADEAARSGAGHRPRIVIVSARDAASFGARLRDADVEGFLAKHDLSGPALRSLLGAA